MVLIDGYLTYQLTISIALSNPPCPTPFTHNCLLKLGDYLLIRWENDSRLQHIDTYESLPLFQLYNNMLYLDFE
jgi:hypothetical protein